MHLPKVTVDDFFFSTQEQREKDKLEHIQNIKISEITDFPNHPYKVLDDDEMLEMSESIKENGVIHPVIVRAKKDGGYEMISGHRRKRATELAGIREIPAIIRQMTDDEATIYMVDSNKQRVKVLPSEKAFAYKMKLNAMKRQGKRNDLTSSPMATKLNEKGTAEIIGQEFGDGKDNVYRYIKLTELIPELLQLVDDEKIALRPAVEISYLNQEEQETLLDAIETTVAYPSHAQAIILRKKSQDKTLTTDDIYDILDEEKPNQKEQIKFKVDNVREYFPKGYTTEQMQNTIKKLLMDYKNNWLRRQRDNIR
ncbi:MAG: ParB/RepB/Spo0J family partition protein [Clostridiales bacterium]|nr:ParB/RepB/Spo0J family partition protein [Clostridiales bacterium]